MADISEKEFDIIGFAKSIMNEIENVRSFDELIDDKTGDTYKTPTETRIDAFFRLIGLPYFVIISDKESNKKDDVKFLNSGFGASVNSTLANKEIVDNKKQIYATVSPSGKDLEGNVAEILEKRKSELKKINEEIGKQNMNERMGLAICSPADVKANIPSESLGKTEAFIPRAYPGNGPDTENIRIIFKQLFPLIPSFHRVLPLRNQIARPFTLSVKERRIDGETILRKPFLEQVIRIRFVEYGNSQTDEENKTEEDITSSIKYFIGETQFNEIFSGDFLFTQTNRLEQFIIIKFLYAIKNLARKWVKINEQRVRLLRKISPVIAIKTSSSRASMFGKRIEISTVLDGTEEGEKLKKLNSVIALEEALISLLPTDENEKTDPKKSSTRNITPSALQNPFNMLIRYNLQKNIEDRDSIIAQSKKNINNLERIRLELDLMTGEFSGLSLPDIVITIASLFIVKRETLLNLLDKYTIDLMKTDKVLKTIIKDVKPEASNAMIAIQDLEIVIEQLFSLFQIEVDATQNRKNQGKQARSIRSSDDKSSTPPRCAVSTKET